MLCQSQFVVQSVLPVRTVLRGPGQHGADNHCQQSEAICSGLDF